MQLAKSLGMHIYRLRRLFNCSPIIERGHYIRDEFQSSPLMCDIAPLRESRFYFEPITGGEDFFSYAHRYNYKYSQFVNEPQVRLLRDKFLHRHRPYAEISETILFGYYLKFGSSYLSEALYCIMSKLAEHRYDKTRALEEKVLKFAEETGLVRLIESSSSPTFFIASALRIIKKNILDFDIPDGIRWDFYRRMSEMVSSLDIKTTDIKNRIENEY